MSSSGRLRNEKYFFYKYAKENTKTKNLKKAVKTEIEKKEHMIIYFLWERILWVVSEQLNFFNEVYLVKFDHEKYDSRRFLLDKGKS